MRTSIRIAALAGALALATSLAVIGFIAVQTYNESSATLRREVTQQSHIFAGIYRSGGMPALKNAIDDTLEPDDLRSAAAILGPRGTPLYGNIVALFGPADSLSEGYRSTLIRVRNSTAPHEAGVYLQPIASGGWIAVARLTGEGLALRETLERSLLIGVALSLVLGMACGVLVARFVDRRVRAIGEVAVQIGSGDLRPRVPLGRSRDSFEKLAQHINAMLDRIQILMGELQMLTDTLAHDLRSPIGRLRSAADAALNAPSSEVRDELLAKIIQESDSLTRILTTILEIGRTESFASRKQFTSFDVAQLGAEIAEMYEPLGEEAGVEIQFERRGSEFRLQGHRQLLAQAMSNLIENALNYGCSGGRIVVFVEQRSDRLRIGVADRGPGIPADQQEEAFRRFGRLDSSRSKIGAGLGLTLARSIAHLHTGKLILEDAEPGLVAVLDLPLG